MIYVFHGDDGFSAHEALHALVEAVGPEDVRDPNVAELDGGSFDVAKFGAAAMVMPFLAERRMVVTRGLLTALGGSTGGGRRRRRGKARDTGDELGAAAGLPELLAQLPPTTDAVFLDGRLTNKNPLLVEIEALDSQQVQLREFPVLRRDPLARWVRERATLKGASIAPGAIESMVELVGGNLWAMDNELEKLATYRLNGTIEAEDVDALVAGARETSVFELVDALMEGRADTAMARLDSLLRDGSGGPYLITMIARQARMLALAHELGRERVPQAEWGQRLGTSSDFVVRKTADQARRFPLDAVRALYHLLVGADLAMKTGEAADDVVLAELVARAVTLRHGVVARR